MFLALAFLVWAIIATGFAGYYQISYTNIKEAFDEIEGVVTKASILIDYGNGTEVWHNETIVVAGSSPLDALLVITENVNLSSYNGNYITGIDGRIEGDSSGWTWWLWNSEESEWGWSLEAVNEYTLHPEEIVRFQFATW